MEKPNMGYMVKLLRPKKTDLIYCRHQDGKITVCELPEQIKDEVNSTIQFRTYRKYLPILLIEKPQTIVRVFRHPKKELFKNNNLKFIER
jgi:16S rRNA U1498 N3-methylase RsmE